MKNLDTNKSNAEKEIKENIISFYEEHKQECDELYAKSIQYLSFYDEENSDSKLNSLFINTSVVILTANTFEKNLLHINAVEKSNQSILHFNIKVLENKQNPLCFNIYFFKINNYTIANIHANQTGSYTMGGSADIVRFVLKNNFCFPSVIVSYGICFGNEYNDKRYQIGDTIIAKKLYPYFMSAKVQEDRFIVVDSNIFEIDASLNAKIKHYMDTNCFYDIKKNICKNVFFANMITGEAVISNAIIKEIIIKAASNQIILGGEMEGYGLFKECQGYEFSVPCLLIKSICDWGAIKNFNYKNINIKDCLQAYAANSACEVLFKLFDLGLFKNSIYDEIKKVCMDPEDKSRTLTKDMVEKYLIEEVKKRNPLKSVQNSLVDCIIIELQKNNIIKNSEDGVFYYIKS